MLTAIIVAGGSSRRMGFDKTFASLGGRPIVAHSIAAFEATGCVDSIILVARAERITEFREVVARCECRKVAVVVPGGTHRQDSVSAGLSHLSEDCRFVAVHDAARPLVTPGAIARVFEAACAGGAAALAARVSDTLKRADGDGFVCDSIERERVYAMQTPQIFDRELLLNAYQRIAAEGLAITDEVSALQHFGRRVMLVANEAPNFKITYPDDLRLAEYVMATRRQTTPAPET